MLKSSTTVGRAIAASVRQRKWLNVGHRHRNRPLYFLLLLFKTAIFFLLTTLSLSIAASARSVQYGAPKNLEISSSISSVDLFINTSTGKALQVEQKPSCSALDQLRGGANPEEDGNDSWEIRNNKNQGRILKMFSSWNAFKLSLDAKEDAQDGKDTTKSLLLYKSAETAVPNLHSRGRGGGGGLMTIGKTTTADGVKKPDNKPSFLDEDLHKNNLKNQSLLDSFKSEKDIDTERSSLNGNAAIHSTSSNVMAPDATIEGFSEDGIVNDIDGITEDIAKEDTRPLRSETGLKLQSGPTGKAFSNMMQDTVEKVAVTDEEVTALSAPDLNNALQKQDVAFTKTDMSTVSQAPNSTVVEVSAAVKRTDAERPYISTGYWSAIDKVASLGLSTTNENLRLSRHLLPIRKAAARTTGLHGLISGKGREEQSAIKARENKQNSLNAVDDFETRNAAFQKAHERDAARLTVDRGMVSKRRRDRKNVGTDGRAKWRQAVSGFVQRRRRKRFPKKAKEFSPDIAPISGFGSSTVNLTPEERRVRDALEAAALADELSRQNRVQEIDQMIHDGQERLLELQCEKDDLQRRPNPLYNYTTSANATSVAAHVQLTERKFNFPPPALVNEYIDGLFTTGRLSKIDHTELWRSGSGTDDDDEAGEWVGDDLLTPSADARKLYRHIEYDKRITRKSVGNGGSSAGGSWLLRQTLGSSASLGEKIGEAAENAAYQGVCSAVMSILARSIAALHGLNIMNHSDIRLFVENAPDLPPFGNRFLDEADYAQEAIKNAMRKGAKKKKRKKNQSSYHYGHDMSEAAFIQRDAVVETLISHCQISAPLLKLFPLAWQRAVIGNIITLVAAVVSDFADGVQFQIVGHQLSFSFKPITEADMIQHIGMGGFRFNNRRSKPEEFEAAVSATAQDISENLDFLDRWHERALGGGMLRAQVGNLIARLVLTLVDEVLSGARMDLWSAQVGGPRIVAGLEYRTKPETLFET